MLIKKISLALTTVILTLVVLELALRYVQPFGFTLKGHTIVLPTNTSVTYEVAPTEKLDPLVTVKKNSLGFRGENPPARFHSQLTLVTVGGSTTESILVPEQKTWTDILGKNLSNHFDNVWINSAGFDGHSTFGHLILTNDYLVALRPKYALFLVGTNDLALFEGKEWDAFRPRPQQQSLLDRLAEHSALVALYKNIQRLRASQQLGLSSRNVIDFDSVVPSMEKYPDYKVLGSSTASATLSDVVGSDEELDEYVAAYRQRLEQLVITTRNAEIEPVLITQPALYGPAVDDVTGVNLEDIVVDTTNGVIGAGMVGREKWSLLEAYNQATRSVAKAHNVKMIDLAAKLPKSSRYYYDFVHFSNAGSQEVASLVYKDLCHFLWEREPSLRSTACPM
mgnify:CR=1 FL=1